MTDVRKCRFCLLRVIVDAPGRALLHELPVCGGFASVHDAAMTIAHRCKSFYPCHWLQQQGFQTALCRVCIAVVVFTRTEAPNRGLN